MNATQKEALHEFHDRIVDSNDDEDIFLNCLLNYLFYMNIIQNGHRQAVKKLPVARDRCNKLLEFLMLESPRAFEQLCNAIEIFGTDEKTQIAHELRQSAKNKELGIYKTEGTEEDETVRKTFQRQLEEVTRERDSYKLMLKEDREKLQWELERCRNETESLKMQLYESDREISQLKQTLAASGIQRNATTLPTLLAVIQPDGAGGAGSLAVHGDRLFVGRYNSNFYEVYDTKTFTRQLTLSVDDYETRICGLAVSGVHNCLYVADFHHKKVCKVDLSSYDVVSKWDVNLENLAVGISVNAAHNLLVSCYVKGSKTIMEYTTLGTVVRKIDIKVGHPYHVMEVSPGQLIASLSFPQSVSLIGLDGRVIKAYGSSKGSEPGQLNSPQGLAVDKNRYVLVADCGNNRIMALNPSLTDAREFPVLVDGGLLKPTSLCLDQTNGRLYVGEIDAQGRVLVFERVNDIAGLFNQ